MAHPSIKNAAQARIRGKSLPAVSAKSNLKSSNLFSKKSKGPFLPKST